MIKLGIISAATYGATYRGEDAPRTPGSFHGTAFSATYNGFDEEKAKQWDWTFARAEKRIQDAQVVKIWDPQKEWAERLAETCYIPEVLTTAPGNNPGMRLIRCVKVCQLSVTSRWP